MTAHATKTDALEIGPFRCAGAPAHLSRGRRDDDALLGMSVLKHLEFTARGEVLVLRMQSGWRSAPRLRAQHVHSRRASR